MSWDCEVCGGGTDESHKICMLVIAINELTKAVKERSTCTNPEPECTIKCIKCGKELRAYFYTDGSGPYCAKCSATIAARLRR